jgi:hypothetical protein
MPVGAGGQYLDSIGPKIRVSLLEQAFPCIKHERFFLVQMAEGLHVISGRLLPLKNESSVHGGAFKYKAKKNLGMLYE